MAAWSRRSSRVGMMWVSRCRDYFRAVAGRLSPRFKTGAGEESYSGLKTVVVVESARSGIW